MRSDLVKPCCLETGKPRQRRYFIPHRPQRVIARGVDRQAVWRLGNRPGLCEKGRVAIAGVNG